MYTPFSTNDLFAASMAFCLGAVWLLPDGRAVEPASAKRAASASMTREQIIADAEKMADAQLAPLAGKPPVVDWVGAVMWAGYADFSHVAGQAAARQAVEQVGQGVRWTPIYSKKTPHYADDLCIGQAFLDLYADQRDPEIIAPIRTCLDAAADYILTKEPDDDPASKANQLPWWWCDALFMAPPVHARLTEITHDPRYIESMDKEW